jgi:PAS domain S-box-containing protein/putative nucleotidyltransferase with HDIG domain
MKDTERAKEQLLAKLETLRARVVALEQREAQHRRVEEELLRSKEDWENIFYSIGDPIVVLDRQRRVTAANRAVLTALGKRQEELLGRRCYEIFHGTDHPPVDCQVERVLAYGSQEMWEIDMEAIPGTFLVSCTPVYNATGGIEKVVHTIKDITKRKQAEEELRWGLEKVQRAMEGTIEAMALAIEMRDPFTAGHQRRVAELARAIAEEMGIEGEQLEGILLAGVVHDIGKIYVPAEILSKPGRINEIEFALIKEHCQVGYDILRLIEFPWPIAQIVLQHHERMDGSGYPLGLHGEAILPEARILGVADIVEAMASHRPYRPAVGIDQALNEISRKRGLSYDSRVVDACLRVFAKKGFHFKALPEGDDLIS